MEDDMDNFSEESCKTKPIYTPNDESSMSATDAGNPCSLQTENVSDLVIENVQGNFSESRDDFLGANEEDCEISIEEHPIKQEHSSNKEPRLLDSSSRVTLKRKSDSLALISSYDISSESEDDIITNSFSKPQDPIEIIDSNSDSDSNSRSLFNCESDASNESSQSCDEESTVDKNQKKKKCPPSGAVSNKVKSSLDLGELPPIKDLQISVKEEECLPFGKVHSIVETLVVIESLPDVPALNLDSILFTKTGEPLGEVFDVFGPVKRPYYTLRFKDERDIEGKSLSVGALVYCAPQTKYTQYVFIHELASMKGSDASWKNDMEPPPEFLDYSDDEQEKVAKKVLKEAKIKAKALKVIDVDAPPIKIPTFEERMNQRNTLRNLMFITNPPPDNRKKDWYQSGSSGSRDPGGSSGSTSNGRMRGGLIRSPGFTLPYNQQIAPSPSQPTQFYTQNNRPALNRVFPSHFQNSPGLTPSGFVASRALFSGRGSPFSPDQAQSANSSPFGSNLSNNLFGQPQNNYPFAPAQNRHQFGQSIGPWQVTGGHQFNTAYRPPQPPNIPPFGMNSCGQTLPTNNPPIGKLQPPNRFQAQGVQGLPYGKPVLQNSIPHYSQRSLPFGMGSNIFLNSPLPPQPFSANNPPGPPPGPFTANSPTVHPQHFGANSSNIPPNSFVYPNRPPQPNHNNIPFRPNMYPNSPSFRSFSQNDYH